MLPPSLDELIEQLRKLPGLGTRSSRKLALDLLQLGDDEFNLFSQALTTVRDRIAFCSRCGFFAERSNQDNDEKILCSICIDKKRNNNQICILEKPTDVITVEKSDIYRGTYHVLDRMISPLDNVFAEDTRINAFIERLDELFATSNSVNQVEVIMFLKAGFSSEATTAYIKDILSSKPYHQQVIISRLAQGLPLYYNPETLDPATMSMALTDRRIIT